MTLSPRSLRAWTRTHEGKKLIRYTAASAITTAVSLAAVAGFYGLRIISVSYTHLERYALVKEPGNVKLEATSAVSAQFVAKNGTSGLTPVSYTHLDVYKRQAPPWPRCPYSSPCTSPLV